MTTQAGVLLTALFLALIFDFVWSIWRSTGPLRDRFLASGRNSLTIVWSQLVALVGSGIGAAVWLADLLHEPEIAAAIGTYLDPKVVSIIMVTIAFITVLARRRTLPP